MSAADSTYGSRKGATRTAILFILPILVIILVSSGCISQLNELIKNVSGGSGQDNSNLVPLQDTDNLIISTSNNLLAKDVAGELESAGQQLKDDTGNGIIVTSASRSLKTQAKLFYENCLLPPGAPCSTETCDVTGGTLFSGNKNGYTPKGALDGVDLSDEQKVIDIIAANGKPGNCAHTSNVAVDVWCEGTIGKAANVSCERELTKIMVDKGFCRLTTEPWHFEWAARSVSKGCVKSPDLTYWINGKPIDPTTDLATGRECLIWNYTSHGCKMVKPEDKGEPEPNPNPTPTPASGSWSGTFVGTFSFTNNCPATATCRYDGKSGAITLQLVQTGNQVKGTVFFNTQKFTAKELAGSNGGGCPTLSAVVPGQSEISGTADSSGLTLTDVGDDVWKLHPVGSHFEGTISSNDPYCLGMVSNNLVFNKQ